MKSTFTALFVAAGLLGSGLTFAATPAPAVTPTPAAVEVPAAAPVTKHAKKIIKKHASAKTKKAAEKAPVAM